MERARRACSWQSISGPTWAPGQATCVGAASKATRPELVGPGRSWPVLAAPGRSGPALVSLGRSKPVLAALGRSWPLLPVPGCSRPLRAAPGRSWPLGRSLLLLAAPVGAGRPWPLLATPVRSGLLSPAPGRSWLLLAAPSWLLSPAPGFWGVRPPKLPTGIEDAASRVAKATCFWGGPDGKAGNGTRALEEAASGARQSHVFSVVLEGPAPKVADRRRGCGL